MNIVIIYYLAYLCIHTATPYNAEPGMCVLINNMVFNNPSQMRSLETPGQRDEAQLRVLFELLSFEVRWYRNLTSVQMISRVEQCSRMEHNGVFFLIILSHGGRENNEDVVYGTDGVGVSVYRLKSYFHTTLCPSLHEVPKIIIIEACRGSEVESRTVVPHHNSRATTVLDPRSEIRRTSSGTDSAHFAIVYASTRGNIAFTNGNGSRLTQTLVAVISEARADISFSEILTEVQARIQHSNSEASIQTVEIVNTLCRNYFIKRLVMTAAPCMYALLSLIRLFI